MLMQLYSEHPAPCSYTVTHQINCCKQCTIGVMAETSSTKSTRSKAIEGTVTTTEKVTAFNISSFDSA